MMKVSTVSCPACGSPLSEAPKPNQQIRCAFCGSVLSAADVVRQEQNVCPTCHAVNSASARFCIQCGASLKVACPSCHTINEVDFVCCQNCGVNLQRAWQRKQAWLAEKRQYDAQRLSAWKQAQAESRKAQLQRLLNELDEPENHAMAIYSLRQFGAEAVAGLIALLSHQDPDARYGAAQALGLTGDPRAIPALIEALADPEPAVRYWAVDALGKLRAEAAVEAIGALLHDCHEGVQGHAAEALQQIGTAEARQVLQEAKKAKWWPFG